MIILTTSHRPTRRVRSLCNDLASSIPGLIKVNRGKMGLIDVAEKTICAGSEKFIIVDRWKGCPGRIRFYKIFDREIREEPPRIYISGVKLRREFKTPCYGIREKINSLFLNASKPLNRERELFRSKLSEILEVPMLKMEGESLNYQAYMHVDAGEDCWAYISFFLLPGKVEVGPRIKVSHAVWDL
ncbi:MAG: hypothetical protein N3E47_05580 [Candidatus Bathyarchaeota archaeon]|nr:hypothetical protein [Candidatus Bathyarchaeota archaeon]